MVGGAWPFLVGGAICLVNSDNERDFDLLNSVLVFCLAECSYCFDPSRVGVFELLACTVRVSLLRGTSGVRAARN